MRKKVYGRKFSRDFGSRKALFRSLEKAVIERGLIKTTYIKAKAIQGDLDKMALLSRKKDLNSVKKLVSILGNDKGIASLLLKRAESFLPSRMSGFTRIIKLPRRFGDNALMARLEWVDKEVVKEGKSKVKSAEKPEEVKGNPKTTLKEKVSTLAKKAVNRSKKV